MTERENYLARQPLLISEHPEMLPDDKGPADFDIQDSIHGSAEVVRFESRTKNPTRYSNRIRAFWLPWLSRGTMHLDIDNSADFFFTANLNGCQFRAAPTGPHHLRTVHVAGNMKNARNAKGSALRTRESDKRLRAVAEDIVGRPRSLTVSLPLGESDDQGEGGIRYGYEHDDVSRTIVVGFRSDLANGHSKWDIWYQSVGRANEADPYRVIALNQLM